jgi:hypothetical protein
MNTLPDFCTHVPLDKAYRLLNHGPTVLVSSAHAGEHNVMAAAWSMPLDFQPPKVTVVIDKATRTRALVEGSGWFALNIPARALAQATLGVGTDSALTTQDKTIMLLARTPNFAFTQSIAWLIRSKNSTFVSPRTKPHRCNAFIFR